MVNFVDGSGWLWNTDRLAIGRPSGAKEFTSGRMDLVSQIPREKHAERLRENRL